MHFTGGKNKTLAERRERENRTNYSCHRYHNKMFVQSPQKLSECIYTNIQNNSNSPKNITAEKHDLVRICHDSQNHINIKKKK